MRFHGATELLDQGTAPVPELGRIFFGQSKPVICRKTILFNAIAFEMGEPNHKLSGDEALSGSFEVGFDGPPPLNWEWHPRPIHGLSVAFLKKKEKQFKPVRHS